jgi:hypothetical protein
MIFLVFIFVTLLSGGIYFMERVNRKVQINVQRMYTQSTNLSINYNKKPEKYYTTYQDLNFDLDESLV